MTIELEYLPADIFGLSSVARAALAGHPAVGGLPLPRTLAEFPPAEERHGLEEREELATALEERLTAFEPNVGVLDSVRSLRQQGVFMVIAGQQPGYLGGPLYNLWKAVHAIRLARALQEAWNQPVIPVFWNHADDHDIGEVHHQWVMTPTMDLRKLGLSGALPDKRPLSKLVFNEARHQLAATTELLRNDLFVTPGLADEIEVFTPREGESFSNAFTRMLISLFGEHGLVPIEPDWIRPQLSHHLAHIVGGNVQRALAAGSAELRESGFEPAIDPKTAALLFGTEGGKRRALRDAEGSYRYDEEPGSRTAAELAAEIVQAPHDFSAGALLRPVVQDAALPSCAYIGGWGELAYHAQLGPLRDASGTPRTAFVPRLSCTLIDPESAASLTKLGASAGDVLRAKGTFGEDAENEQAPAVVAELRAIAERTSAELGALRQALSELDPGLGAQTRRARSRAQEAIETLAKKAERVHANSSGKGKRHLRRVNNGLMPRGLPQERVRGALEFLPRFGRAWLRELIDEVDPLPTEHLAVKLSAQEER